MTGTIICLRTQSRATDAGIEGSSGSALHVGDNGGELVRIIRHLHMMGSVCHSCNSYISIGNTGLFPNPRLFYYWPHPRAGDSETKGRDRTMGLESYPMNCKQKIALMFVSNVYRGRRGTYPLTLALGSKWRWVNFTLQPPYSQVTSNRYLSNRMPTGRHSPPKKQ